MKIKLVLLTIGIFVFIPGQNLFAQDLQGEIKTDLPSGSCILTSGLVNEDKTMLLIGFSDFLEAARKTHYYLINLETNELISHFNVNRWTYLMDAYFHEKKYLYISFGIKIRTKYMIYDIFTGERIGKILDSKSPKGAGYLSKGLEFRHSGLSKNGGKIILDDTIITYDSQTSTIQIFSK